MDTKALFDRLMARGNIDGLSDSAAIKMIGEVIDLSGDLHRDDGISRALEWCDEFTRRPISDQSAVVIEYFRANAWGHRQNKRHRNRVSTWDWEQPELEKQIFYLRYALRLPGFTKLRPLRRCQILTNLGNQLNTVGRFAEALEFWDRALSVVPQFGMALGNRGYGLERYAASLYDFNHQYVFLRFAHRDLSKALSSQAKYDGPYGGAKSFFTSVKNRIEASIDIKKVARTIELNGDKTGRSREERRYREWCLQNRLFLNPLNDLGCHSIAARDILSLPDFTTPIGEAPTLIGFFNQMKQEFVSGRWLLYEGIHSCAVHYSDRQVTLYNTLDYPRACTHKCARADDLREFALP